MAYFPNGSSGDCFAEQCYQCRYGDRPCPIYYVQSTYNYDACNNEVATKILDHLVSDDGTCSMFKMDPDTFRSDHRKQIPMFPVQQEQCATCEHRHYPGDKWCYMFRERPQGVCMKHKPEVQQEQAK